MISRVIASLSWRKDFRGFAILAVLLAIGWLSWKGARDPAIPLLTPGPADWIIYPSPPHAKINSDKEISSEFVRQLVLASAPTSAEIQWRAFCQSELSINGLAIAATGEGNGNWKETSRLEIAKKLRAGTNTISMTVWNSNGPPALSLRLDVDGNLVKTDENWSASIAGSTWRPALLASASVHFGEGNDLHGLLETGSALRECWPWLCGFFVIAAVLAGLEFKTKNGDYFQGGLLLAAAFAPAGLLLLFVHNAFLLPGRIGFDASSHLDYITFIQQKKALPSPTDGWEMFQGPLYYLLSAGLLALGHLKTSEWAGLLLLRGLNIVMGAANVAFIYGSLRLLFPGEWKKQVAGALLAAFLPAQICLLHYTTNETLSATLMSAALFLCLRILSQPKPSMGLHVALGCVLGLALLAKVSAVVFFPVIFAVLGGKLILERQIAIGQWIRTIGVVGGCALLVAGWRYARLWKEFGTPLIGNWDPRISPAWWQPPGYHTSGYFLSWGKSLTAPLFSGFDSFLDCFYTTLWGDGLAGGSAATNSLPPWNYSLMDAGYLLALAPSALVLTGLCAALSRCSRKPDLPFLLLVGTAGSATFAVVYMTMKLAFYSQGKCFYGLPALLPLCVFAVMGMDFLARRGRLVRLLMAAAMLMWGLNVYASFWIHPDGLQTEIYTALSKSSGTSGVVDGRSAVDKLLRDHPANITGLVLRSQSEEATNAVQTLMDGLRQNPASGEIAMFLASRLRDIGQTNEALSMAEHAVDLAPENLQAANLACGLATQLGKSREALDAGRIALELDPGDPTLQFNVGCAWATLREPVEAIQQFEMLLALKPPASLQAQAHFYLGRLLSSQPGRKADAISHFQAALQLEPENADYRRGLNNIQPIKDSSVNK